MVEGGFTCISSVEFHQWKSALLAFNAEVLMEERSKNLSVHVSAQPVKVKNVAFSWIKQNKECRNTSSLRASNNNKCHTEKPQEGSCGLSCKSKKEIYQL